MMLKLIPMSPDVTMMTAHFIEDTQQGCCGGSGAARSVPGGADNDWLPWNHLCSQDIVHFLFPVSLECMVPVIETGIPCLPHA